MPSILHPQASILSPAAKVGDIPVVDQREDAAADRGPRLALVAGLAPGPAERLDLLGLLDVQRLARFVELEG